MSDWCLCYSSLVVAHTVLAKEGNVLYNDALSTFNLQLYGVRCLVKDYSGRRRGNLLLPHRLLFPISSKGYFICIIPQTHTTAFVTPVVEHWLKIEIAPLHHERTLLPRSYSIV